MSSKKRHPVMWPQMKIRGRRRRVLAALRRTHVTVIPYARVVMNEPGMVTITALSASEPGSVMVRHSIVLDGFGRPRTGGA